MFEILAADGYSRKAKKRNNNDVARSRKKEKENSLHCVKESRYKLEKTSTQIHQHWNLFNYPTKKVTLGMLDEF